MTGDKEKNAKAGILVFSDYYLPGYKGGGPIRTLANLIEHLGGEYDFNVITRDRDLGDSIPYPETENLPSMQQGKAKVFYRAEKEWSFRRVRKKILTIKPDLLYLNSFFSLKFSIGILVLRRFGFLPRIPVVLAPRGEFSAGAISINRIKKLTFIIMGKALGLYGDVVWQASSQYEEQDIRRFFGRKIKCLVAPDMAEPPARGARTLIRKEKVKDELDVIFLSRISPMKNLDGLLRILKNVRKSIRLDIYGPVEDEEYWGRCKALIEVLPSHVRVEYRGIIPHEEVKMAFESHDLFFLPTRGENFGHVILESLLAGCPVLISDQTPWRNLAQEGVGWDLPLADWEPYRNVLEGCCNMTAAEFQVYSQKAHAYGLQSLANGEVLELNRNLFNNALLL